MYIFIGDSYTLEATILKNFYTTQEATHGTLISL
jgi:hypothetical protein